MCCTGVRHDGHSPRKDFHTESDVDSSNLQETSAKGTSRESRSSLRGEKPSTANDNFTGIPVDHGYLVKCVFRLHRNFGEIGQVSKLYAVRPVMIDPGVENRRLGIECGIRHGFELYNKQPFSGMKKLAS